MVGIPSLVCGAAVRFQASSHLLWSGPHAFHSCVAEKHCFDQRSGVGAGAVVFDTFFIAGTGSWSSRNLINNDKDVAATF